MFSLLVFLMKFLFLAAGIFFAQTSVSANLKIVKLWVELDQLVFYIIL